MSLVIIGCFVQRIRGRNNVISNRRDDTSAYIGGNSKELRKATILKYVLQMKFVETPQVKVGTEGGNETDIDHNDVAFVEPSLMSSSNPKVIPTEDSNEPQNINLECSICMENYNEGETICWSSNEECSHVFHLSCITDWLLNHEECPLCRCNFLNCIDGKEDEENPNLEENDSNSNGGNRNHDIENNDDAYTNRDDNETRRDNIELVQSARM